LWLPLRNTLKCLNTLTFWRQNTSILKDVRSARRTLHECLVFIGGNYIMSNQTVPDELADNDFEFQLRLERAFAQLEGDDSNALLINGLEILALRAQNKCIPNIATKIGKDDDETRTYLFESGKRLLQYPPIRKCWEEMKAANVKGASIMFNEDNHNWIDLLAGKSVPDAEPKMVRETQIFRAALLSYADKPKNVSEIPYPHILENVFTRLEAEGLLKPPKQSWLKKRLSKLISPNPNKLHGSTLQWYKLALVASVLVVALIIPFRYYVTEPNIIPKSIKPCVNELFEPQQPPAVNLQKELEAFEITTKLTSIDNGWRLETTLPAVISPALDDLLKHYDLIVLPESNYLCVDILSKEVK